MISITWVSRNDNHGEHLIPRIQAAANALVFQRNNGLDLELIFVEWNPPDGPRLHDVIQFQNQFPVRWYVVSKQLHESFPNSDILDIYPHIGANVGMRRAAGDWFLTTTHDCIFSSRLALELRYLHHPEFFYRTERRDGEAGLPGEMSTVERIHYMDDHPSDRERLVWRKGIYTRSCGDFILCHKDAWNDLRGYPEWAMNGIWLDGLFLSRFIAHGIDQYVFPYPIYHMDHGGKGLDTYREQPHLPHHVYRRMAEAMRKRQDPFTINDINWGMADLHEHQIRDNVWVLEGTYAHRPIGWKKVDKLLAAR